MIGSISIASAQVTKIGTGQNPAIYGSEVTWSDTAGSIHVYDLTAQKDTIISSSGSSQPAIYGNKIVWHDESSGTPMLTIYDIPSGQTSSITQNVDSTSIPKIYDYKIVWSAEGNVYIKQETTQTEDTASINLYGEKTKVTMEEEIQCKFSVVNYITKPTMYAQVIFIVPNGMSVSGENFAYAGACQYTSNFTAAP